MSVRSARRQARPQGWRWPRRRSVRPPRDGLTPLQRRFDLLVGTLFGLWVALILNWGAPQVPWRVGDRPDHNLEARVGYQYPNAAAQATLEAKAADATPNVYRRDDANLRALEVSLALALPAIKAAPNRASLPAEVRRAWDLTDGQFDAFKAALNAETKEGQLLEGLRQLLAILANTGLIDRERHAAEVDERHERITVLSPPGSEADPGPAPLEAQAVPYRRDMLLIAQDRTNVAGFLEAQAATVLGALGAGENVRETLMGALAARVGPNLIYDAELSRQARRAAAARVGLVLRTVQPGEILVKRRQEITPSLLEELKREHAAYLDSRPPAEPIRRMVALTAVALLLTGVTGALIWRLAPRILRSKPRLIVFSLLVIVVVATARALYLAGWPIYLTPAALVAMALAIAYDQRLALGAAFVLGVLAALATTVSLGTAVIIVVGCVVGVYGTQEVRNRARLIEVGFAVGLASAVAITVVGFMGHSSLIPAAAAPFWPTTRDALWGLLNGVMTGFIITGGLPFIEMLFNFTTDISLLELTDANQPLLRRLALEAPGTYNHSLVVGSLAEAAAEAIGANPLLSRLGALFHDVGKVKMPGYFVENRTDTVSRHDHLRPRMSALVIAAHVKDGVHMAVEHRLPRVIRDLIAQHHGTTLIEYFYQEAHRQAARSARPAGRAAGVGPNSAVPTGRGPSNPAQPDETAFRYPGPKPSTREAAIVMLADAVESASRSMNDPAPARIENLVREIVRRRIDDGQFDDCAITFKEVATVQSTLAAALTRVYHSRIRYPDQEPENEQ